MDIPEWFCDIIKSFEQPVQIDTMSSRDVSQSHAPFLEHNFDRCFIVFAYDHPYPTPRVLHTLVGTPQRLLDRSVFVDVAASIAIRT